MKLLLLGMFLLCACQSPELKKFCGEHCDEHGGLNKINTNVDTFCVCEDGRRYYYFPELLK